MKNLIFTLLNKTLSSQTPDNYTETSIKINGLGKFILGVIIGVITTLCITSITKSLKKSKNNNDHNNDTKN